MRNFARWKTVMKVGAVLTDLSLKDNKLIDADSRFNFIAIKSIPNKDSYLKVETEKRKVEELIQPKLF